MLSKNGLKLYRYLAQQKYPKSEQELLEHFQYSKSTFNRAKRELRDQGITLLPPQNGGYKLLEKEKNFVCLGEYLMDQQDIIDLVQVIKLLSPIANKHNLNEQVKLSLQKLLTVLPEQYNDKLDFIDYFAHGEREQSNDIFQDILSAFSQNKRLKIQYSKRAGGVLRCEERQVSPQKILRYRSNWYVIAYCHLRQEIRTFSLDNITEASIVDTPIQQLDRIIVSDYYQQTYGIFSGSKIEMATLKFSKSAALWIKNECWHPEQQSYFDDDQTYILSIPIGENLTELIMQLAMYGKDVEVIAPARLKQALREHHQQALNSQN